MESIITAFSTLGFPVACVAVMGYFIFHFIKKIQDESSNRENNLMELITTCQGKLVDVATVLERLCNEVEDVKREITTKQ